jgi:hypothetical protein
MMTGAPDEGRAEEPVLRERQERAVALVHSLTQAEHELAREALELGDTLRRAGIAFDPLTFVAVRIVEGSCDHGIDPVDCLNELAALGFLERSVAMAVELLEDAA